MELGLSIVLVLLFTFFVMKTMKLRDIDRTDAKFDDVDVDLRPKEYVPRGVRKRVLVVMYVITLAFALALVAEIVWLWPG